MDRELRRQSDRDTLTFLKEERELAMDTIDKILKGWTFHQAEGSDPLRDVTAERETYLRDKVARIDSLIDAYENRNA